MGGISAKTKSISDAGAAAGAILRRQRGAVAAFRRDRRTNDARAVPAPQAVAIPMWGRIVLRTATTTLR